MKLHYLLSCFYGSCRVAAQNTRAIFFAGQAASGQTAQSGQTPEEEKKAQEAALTQKAKSLEGRLEEEKNRFGHTYEIAKQKLNYGDIDEKTLVIKLLEGDITRDRFETLIKAGSEVGKDDDEKKQARELVHMELTAKIKPDTFDLALEVLEHGNADHRDALDKLIKKQTPVAEKTFEKKLKLNPLPKKEAVKQTIEAYGSEEAEMRAAEIKKLVNAEMMTYHEYMTRKIDTPTDRQHFLQLNEKFRSGTAKMDTLGEELRHIFRETVRKDGQIEAKTLETLEDTVMALRDRPLHLDEELISQEQIENAIRDAQQKTNFAFPISPRAAAEIYQRFTRMQQIDHEMFRAMQEMKDMLRAREKEVERRTRAHLQINATQLASGITLIEKEEYSEHSGAQRRSAREDIDKSEIPIKVQYFDKVSRKKKEAEVRVSIVAIEEDEKVEWEGKIYSNEDLPVVVVVGENTFTLGRFQKWVEETNAVEIIQSQKDLEEKIGFNEFQQPLRPGMELQWCEIRRDQRGAQYEISKSTKIQRILDGKIQLDREVVIETPEGAKYADLKEDKKQQTFDFGSFAKWIRKWDVVPMLTTKQERQKAGIKENTVYIPDTPDSRDFKGAMLTPDDIMMDSSPEWTSYIFRGMRKRGLHEFNAAAEAQKSIAPLEGTELFEEEFTKEKEKLQQRATEFTKRKLAQYRALSGSSGAPVTPTNTSASSPIIVTPRSHRDDGGGHGGADGAGAGGGGHGGTGAGGGIAEETDHEDGGGHFPPPHPQNLPQSPGGPTHGPPGFPHGGEPPHSKGPDEPDHPADRPAGHEKGPAGHGDDAGSEQGAHDKDADHAAADHEEKISDVHTSTASYLKSLWNNTVFLTGQDIWQLLKSCYEYYVRWYERKAKHRYSMYGKDLPKISTEMLRIKEEAEHQEVGKFKEAMVHMGVLEIKHIMYSTTNKDQLKACMETLVEKGQMRWDDIALWKSVNHHLPAKKQIRYDTSSNADPYKGVYKDPTTGKLLTGMDMLQKGIDFMWGDNQFNNWWSSNDGKFNSNMNTFNEKGSQLENDPKNNGGVTAHLQMLLRNHMEGGWTDPQEYEGTIRFIIDAGKSGVEEKFYYIVMGVATGILSLDRIGAIDGKYLNKMPWLDYLTDKGSAKPFQDGKEGPYTIPQLKKLAGYLYNDPNIKKPDEKFLPSRRTKDFLWEYVLRDERTLWRTNKGIRKANEIDHEDTPFIVPLVSETNAEVLTKLQNGANGMFSTEGYLNAYSGYSQFMKVNAGLGDWQKLKNSIKAFIKFDGILNERYRPLETGYQRLSVTDYDRRSIVDGLKVSEHKSQISDMVVRIGQAYGYDWSKAFEKETQGNETRQKEISKAIQILGDQMETAIREQGPKKFLQVVNETQLFGTGETLTPAQKRMLRQQSETATEGTEMAEAA